MTNKPSKCFILLCDRDKHLRHLEKSTRTFVINSFIDIKRLSNKLFNGEYMITFTLYKATIETNIVFPLCVALAKRLPLLPCKDEN